ncbi:MAG: T9SS type A sorting domain-containing protein [Saprospiraceae bacterium]
MRTLFLLSFLFIQSALFAQIKFTIDAQDDGVTYLVKLMPEASYDFPMNITNTAQISFVVQTGGFTVGNIQNIKGSWQSYNNIIAPASNPSKDYFVFNLVSHIKDIDYTEGEEVTLFSFENVGKHTGTPKFVTSEDIKEFKIKKLNVGNQISVLGAGFTNAFSGIYVTDEEEEYEEGPESEDSQVLYGTEIFGTFDLGLDVEKTGLTLEWLAENKGKTQQFVIEKSMDGLNFQAIDVLVTDGFSDTLKKTDQAPDFGTNYYRVKQVYKNGDYQYSKVQSEQYLVDDASITIYPNPVKDVFNLKVGHFSDLEGQIRIFSMSGQEVASRPLAKGNKTVQINMSDVQNGMYFLIIDARNRKVIERQFMVESGK